MKAVMYHYVRSFNENFPNFRYLNIENFKKQLDYFENKFGFVSLDEWEKFVTDGFLPDIKGKVILTFDDSLSCHYSNVFRELKKRNLWGIFYIATDPYTKGTMLSVHKVHSLCGKFSGTKLNNLMASIIEDDMLHSDIKKDLKKNTYIKQKNNDGINNFKRTINYYLKNEHKSYVLNEIASFLDFKYNLEDFYISEINLTAMSNSNMFIGSQTQSHPVMSNLSYSDQKIEIEGSIEYLESKNFMKVRTYCHPFGGFYSFNDHTINILNANNFVYSFSTESRDIVNLDFQKNLVQSLPRYDCNEFFYGKAD